MANNKGTYVHVPYTSRGLGKPIYRDGKRVGQRFMVWDKQGKSLGEVTNNLKSIGKDAA